MTSSSSRDTAVHWPNFIGIGVQKAGSTWLYKLLATHPDIWMPPQRSEVHFFDRYYDRGAEWYSQFFPPAGAAQRYRAIGEFTPSYYDYPPAAKRIREFGSVKLLLVSLRDPVARAFSYYQFRARVDHYRGSFEQFLVDEPNIIASGYYARNLKPFVEEFGRERILALLFEDAVTGVEQTKQRLAAFLGVSVDGFAGDGRERVNASFRPRHPALYSMAHRLGRWMREHDLYGVIQVLERAGLKRIISKSSPEPTTPPPAADTWHRLGDLFAQDIDELERLLAIDLSRWKGRPETASGSASSTRSAR
jgi:hypothetical protein